MNTERYNRQILLPELGEEGQTKIRNARVLLVGVGGLGSPIALYLTGAGVGCLGLVDDDVVSISNLHRQVLYNEQEVGQSKAICASRRLQMLNSEVKIETYPFRLTEENAREIIGQYDVVVDGCDNFKTRFLLNDTCQALGIPYVYGGICGWEGQVSIFCHPSSHTTYRTLFPDEAATLSMPHPGKQVIGMTPGIIGSTEATEVIKLIANVGEPLIDKIWAIDLRTLQTHLINL
ncbi:MAG: HesA/MoeB/ThiF family protein [Bacteroides sp.]|nr:HesA/MoeB/ThiF family protein [Bacteroides sp.]